MNTPSSEPGLQHWRWQRGSALVLTPFGLWFIFQMLLLPDFEYQTVISWLATMFNSFAMTVLLIALLVHSLLGLQVVIEDYIASPLQRTLIRITRFIGIAILAASVTSIFTI
ncbi:MAG: succinate dehydrogenase, hydrophobic membrane anchor protein [Proteobacteria bacterium]|nr:succinate dehydrogenase, hydrophobic membrane anchor protein [Pseudomonadota bacterium]